MAQPRSAYAKLEGVIEGSDAPFVRFIEATSVTLGRDRKDKSVKEIQLGGNKALSRKVHDDDLLLPLCSVALLCLCCAPTDWRSERGVWGRKRTMVHCAWAGCACPWNGVPVASVPVH